MTGTEKKTALKAPKGVPDYVPPASAGFVAVRDAMGADGIFNAANNIVSQSVPHLHVHVVPRVRKDGLRGFFWPRTKYASDDEAAAVAERIRSASPAL